MAAYTGVYGVLGLGPHEGAVLEALLDGCDGSPNELARTAGLTPGEVQSAVVALENAGLVGRSAANARNVVPAPPDIAIEALVREREEQLQRARMAAGELAERFSRVAGAGRPPVELVRGREGVIQRYYAMQRAAKDEIIAFDAPPYLNPRHGEPNPVEIEALKRGVAYRVLYDRKVFDLPGTLELLAALVEAGEEARVYEGLPTKMIIVDRKRALVPLLTGDPAGERVLVVQPCALLDALVSLFDFIWERGRPIDASGTVAEPGDPDATDDEELLLIALLGAGLKDEAIARQLDIAERTLRRRIARVMSLLGTTSRFAAGVEAARRGWL